MDFTEVGLTLKEEDLMILRTFINKNFLISLSCISCIRIKSVIKMAAIHVVCMSL